jgi:hypothetical protein
MLRSQPTALVGCYRRLCFRPHRQPSAPPILLRPGLHQFRCDHFHRRSLADFHSADYEVAGQTFTLPPPRMGWALGNESPLDHETVLTFLDPQ